MFTINYENQKKAHAITCLEYCYCAMMDYYKLSLPILYCNSLFTFSEIYNELVKGNFTYITYDDIGRLHHIGRTLGIIEWTTKQVKLVDAEMQNRNNDLPLIVNVEPSRIAYLRQKNAYLNSVSNHLVMMLDSNYEKVHIYDPTMKTELSVPRNEFESAYGGQSYFFAKPRIINLSKNVDGCWAIFNARLHRFVDINMNLLNTVSFLLDEYVPLRDACGIAKVLTSRLIEFIEYFRPCHLIDDAFLNVLKRRLLLLKQLFGYTEYCRIKKTNAGLSAKISRVLENDKELYDISLQAKEKMNVGYCK